MMGNVDRGAVRIGPVYGSDWLGLGFHAALSNPRSVGFQQGYQNRTPPTGDPWRQRPWQVITRNERWIFMKLYEK
jgi:hypothetical protein